jgi:hypothetical protein
MSFSLWGRRRKSTGELHRAQSGANFSIGVFCIIHSSGSIFSSRQSSTNCALKQSPVNFFDT